MNEEYAFTVFWSDLDQAWIADAPDLKSCSAHGRTPEEAVRELHIAMAAWIDAVKANGMTLPPPAFRNTLVAAE